jgi:hypothetical protein
VHVARRVSAKYPFTKQVLNITRPETNQQAVALTSPLRIGLVVSGPSRGAADRSRSQNETLRSRPRTGPHGRDCQHPTERISTRFPLDPTGPGPRDASRAQPRMSRALTAYWGSSGRRTRRGRSEMEWRTGQPRTARSNAERSAPRPARRRGVSSGPADFRMPLGQGPRPGRSAFGEQLLLF